MVCPDKLSRQYWSVISDSVVVFKIWFLRLTIDNQGKRLRATLIKTCANLCHSRNTCTCTVGSWRIHGQRQTDRHTDATLRGSFLASCKGLLKEWRVSKILRAVWLAAPSLGWEEGWGRKLSLWEVNWKWKHNNENVHVLHNIYMYIHIHCTCTSTHVVMYMYNTK